MFFRFDAFSKLRKVRGLWPSLGGPNYGTYRRELTFFFFPALRTFSLRFLENMFSAKFAKRVKVQWDWPPLELLLGGPNYERCLEVLFLIVFNAMSKVSAKAR